MGKEESTSISRHADEASVSATLDTGNGKRAVNGENKGFFVMALVSFSLAFCALCAAFLYLDSNGIVPGRILAKAIIAAGIVILLNAALVILSRRSKAAALICTAVCVVITIASLIGVFLLYKYNESMGEIEKDKEYYAYVGVYVKRGSRFEPVTVEPKLKIQQPYKVPGDDLDGCDVGTMLINVDNGYASQAIRMYRKNHDINVIACDDFGSMIDALRNDEVDAIIYNDAYMSVFLGDDSDFFEWAVEIDRIGIESEHTALAKTADVVSEPFIVYISGIDTTDSAGVDEDTFPSIARSDVNIIAAVDPVKKKILLVNTPRDYYVPLWGRSNAMDKLTHAGVYGIDASISTLESFYDIEINYYVRTNVFSLVKIVDALGGITVHSDFEFYAPSGTGEYRRFHVGENEIDGIGALCFIRERHSFENGDVQRGIHQQEVIRAIIEKACSPAIVAHFTDVLKVVTSSVETNVSREEINALIKMQLSDMASWTLETVSVDGTGSYENSYAIGRDSDPVWVMIPNENN
ncbi:MAG: LCP family protein, partial [Oscillospiraceae bacterium]|nr:LCP family protein [Oscillospiraceae bacterium]